MYQHGGDIYRFNVKFDFSANISPLGIPDSVHKAAQNAIADCVNYPDVYCRELAEKIAQKEHIESHNILCGNGATDLIYRFALAKRPQKALIAVPTFSEYESALKLSGCEICFHTLSEQDNYCLTDSFLDKIDDSVDVVVLCNPNNPTGALIEMSMLQRIVKKCHQTNTFLFLDECFLDFVPYGEKRSLKNYTFIYGSIMILKSFTKMYAIPGLRLGYCICSDVELMEKMRNAGQEWSVSIAAQKAGIAACDETEQITKTVQLIQQEQNYMLSEMKQMGIDCYTPSANYIFFKHQKDLYQKLLEKGILIRDCSNYKGLEQGYFRISIKTHEQNALLLEAIKEVTQ